MSTKILALVPAAMLGFLYFGPRSLLVIAAAIAATLLAEILMCRALKQKLTISDGSAILTGLLLALMMPASMPWWAAVVGGFTAIVLAKWLFGGLGAYPFNPVLISWMMLEVSWPKLMARWVTPQIFFLTNEKAFPVQTYLEILKKYGVEMLGGYNPLDALLGMQGGGIGTIAGAAIILGGLFLIYRGVISWHIPAAYCLGIAAFSGILWYMNPDLYARPDIHLLSGATLLGAFFLAPEYTTSPCTTGGKLFYGLGCGLMTILIRVYGIYPDGTAFAILLMNLCTPMFDRIRPVIIGLGKKEVAANA